MCLWASALLLLWFRRGIGLIWKAGASVVFAFYCFFFGNEITAGLESLKADWYVSALDFFRGLMRTVFADMFFLWPLALFTVFAKADDIGSEKLIRFMITATAALWAGFLIYFRFSGSIDGFFYDKLKSLLP